MNLFIVHHENTHLCENVQLDCSKNKLVVIGERNLNFFKVCKNVSFVNHISKSIRYIGLAKRIALIDKTDFIDPIGISNINYMPKGSFFASNLSGPEELYMMQVMGFLPEILNGKWHDNYIDNSNLDQTDLKEDFIEKYIFEKDKSIFDFNKFKIKTTREILITTRKSSFIKHLKKENNISNVIKNFNENENIYLNPKIWYLKKDINNYCERLYKS
jgi:hypothetical protein